MPETFLRVQGPYQVKYRSHALLGWNSTNWSLQSSGDMVSQNHFPLNTEIDDGGPWLMNKTEDTCVPIYPNNSLWEGALTVGNPRSGWSTLTTTSQPTDLSMIGLGTTAIARCAPANPSVSVPTLIGEIGREGIPALIGRNSLKERTRIARNSGGEYLNIEFGWKPLVSELRSLAKTVNDSATIWNEYRKGSNQKTRVGFHFPSELDTQVYTGDHIPIPVSYTGGFLSGTTSQQRSRKAWFKGCFKYYIPEPVGFGDKMSYWQSQASKLYGVRLTPDIVWNLSPWTWAADWFANTGDLLTNVSNLGTDGLAMQYGYQMSEETLTTEIRAVKNGLATRRTRINKRAKRIAASPYGFTATLSTLTSRQLAIIAALGFTAGK